MKILLCFLAFSTAFFAQQKVSGVIYDKNTKQPVPFVSIGIIGKSIGTVSDEKGFFEFNLKGDLKKDSVKVYAIGYKALASAAEDFIKQINGTVFLESLPTQLEEVIVKSKKVKFKTLGTSDYTKNNCSGFADSEGNWKGSEAAILVHNKKNCLFESFSFYIIQNKYADSLLFRLNVYERISPPIDDVKRYGSDWVGPTLLKKAIVFRVGIKQGEFTLPLKNYNIQTSGDFFISLECLMDEMEIAKFCYSGSYSVQSFFKVKAFSGWHHTKGGGGDFMFGFRTMIKIDFPSAKQNGFCFVVLLTN